MGECLVSKLSSYKPRARHVLIVDDEEDILESLQDLVEAMIEDVQVTTCETGDEALAALAEHDVDLIISDYRMPGMDGLEFLTKSKDVAPQAARILITAFPELDVAMRAINEASIENFFTKPLNTEKIIEAVNAALMKHHAH